MKSWKFQLECDKKLTCGRLFCSLHLLFSWYNFFMLIWSLCVFACLSIKQVALSLFIDYLTNLSHAFSFWLIKLHIQDIHKNTFNPFAAGILPKIKNIYTQSVNGNTNRNRNTKKNLFLYRFYSLTESHTVHFRVRLKSRQPNFRNINFLWVTWNIILTIAKGLNFKNFMKSVYN